MSASFISRNRLNKWLSIRFVHRFSDRALGRSIARSLARSFGQSVGVFEKKFETFTTLHRRDVLSFSPPPSPWRSGKMLNNNLVSIQLMATEVDSASRPTDNSKNRRTIERSEEGRKQATSERP